MQIGDEVLAVNGQGDLEFSPVMLFLDRDPNESRQFFVLKTEAGHALTLTPSHLIYAKTEAAEAAEADFEAVYAKDVREGDFVLVQSSRGDLVPSRVSAVEMRALTGVFAPLTSAGNVVVDNVVASCYAVVDSHSVAHAAFGPLRLLTRLWPQRESHGVHWYANALYSLAEVVMPTHLVP